jgi:disulfide bond formation protein DsbB
MKTNPKRRICGVAAVSATALASLFGAQPASAQTAPPGIVQACDSGPGGGVNPGGRAWPTKWDSAVRCPTGEEGSTYNWWLKVE